ncbi:MAG: glycosyltransferase family 9 protein [Burkholderiales bacterium]|nr:glycosyltransferase family 9 protein [Burkholderiales bacterium]
MNPSAAQKILVIRRDNIGDLVCTTPLLRALRAQLPAARIVVLATRYNAGVLAGNPDIDLLCSYTKIKHRAVGESALRIYLQRIQTILALRRERFDWVLLPGGAQASSLRFARWIGGSRLLVRGDEDVVAGPHEVEQSCHLLARMGLHYETPAPRVVPSSDERARIDALIAGALPRRPPRLIGLHISARKPSQRWPAESFAELARRLAAQDAAFLLLWAPGSADNAQHPGDDEKAARVQELAAGVPIVALPTQRLEDLIAALSACDAVICGDGGAMHVAAGLGKPMVCLFGQSTAERWHPWGMTYELLQMPSMEVKDISVDAVARAYAALRGDCLK